MALRSPIAGQGLLAALESQQNQMACLTEMGQATWTAGELIKKGHIFASSSSPATTPQLGFGNTKMIQCQGTSACFVGATPCVLVGRIGRLDLLPQGSKLGALQKRDMGLTQDVLTCFACAFLPSLPEICAKHKWNKSHSGGECGLLVSAIAGSI